MRHQLENLKFDILMKTLKRICVGLICMVVLGVVLFIGAVVWGQQLKEAVFRKLVSEHLHYSWVIDGNVVYHVDSVQIVSVAWSTGASMAYMVTARSKNSDESQTFRIDVPSENIRWVPLSPKALGEKSILALSKFVNKKNKP